MPRGFAVVHSSSPGTGLSQGCPTVGGQNEALAPKAVVDWLCGRAKGYTSIDSTEEVLATWCNGSVGMMGTSYEGTLPLAAATTGVEGLKAIIPVSPNTSYYHYYRSHGLIRHPGGYMGEDVDVLYDFIHSGYPDGRAWCNENVRDTLMMEGFDRLSGDYNDFWAGRDYLNQLDKLHAAVLIAHGFNDWNVMPAHSVRVYEALKAKGLPVQAYFHQGGHGGDPTPSMVNRWFSHYLYGVDNGVESDARSMIVRTGDKRSAPTAYDDYPHPDAELVELHPGRGGAKAGSLGATFDGGNGSESFTDDVAESGTDLAKAEKSKHRLLYTTQKLAQPLHLSGTSRLRIRMHADAEAANLSVWLVSLPWKEGGHINDNIITRGWADPQNHSSLTESSPLVPGEYVEFTFDLQPDDQIIPKGQSIGLMIFSSDRDFTLWPEAGTELTVDLDATALELAVVGGADAVSAALGK
ncbi:MAG: X-Pro dipeptidyl-peptidase [Planctomycetota bacterium]